MAKTDFKSVDDYIAAQPAAVQKTLGRIRAAIGKAVLAADEMISYQIPAYKLHGKPVLFFAAWKQHISIYPAIGRLQAEFKDELAGYEISKGTVQFPLSEKMPLRLISALAKFRAQEIAKKQRP